MSSITTAGDAVTIVGAGGIGCVLGYALAATGPVTLVETSEAKLAAGREGGVAVSPRPGRAARFLAFADWRPAPGERVLLCTKTYDNPAALSRLATVGAEVLPVQNGIDAALEAFPHDCSAIASFVSECDGERPVTRITRSGDLHIGPRTRGHRPYPWLASLADRLRSTRLFRVLEVPAVRPFQYAKLMYNAAISPLAAAAGIDNGDLLALPEARRRFFGLLRENYRILEAAGIELGRVGPFHPRTVQCILGVRWLARVLAVAFTPSLRGTYCSMANDLPRGVTEVDAYNAHLVALAGERVPCPLNRAVVRLIDTMRAERLPPGRERLRLIPEPE